MSEDEEEKKLRLYRLADKHLPGFKNLFRGLYNADRVTPIIYGTRSISSVTVEGKTYGDPLEEGAAVKPNPAPPMTIENFMGYCNDIAKVDKKVIGHGTVMVLSPQSVPFSVREHLDIDKHGVTYDPSVPQNQVRYMSRNIFKRTTRKS